MDYLGKGEVLTNTDLNKFVNKIWGISIVYVEKQEQKQVLHLFSVIKILVGLILQK